MSLNINILNNATEVAKEIADLIQTNVTSAKNTYNIAISGRNTPRLLFELLAEDYCDSIKWEKIRLFWVDERCVEPNHSESNYRMTYDSLLYKGLLSSDQIFRMHGEEIPANEVLRYTRILQRELPFKNGFPVFDLILLGIGDDGHTASIFPNQLELLEIDDVVAEATNPYTQQKRITLTGKTINSASEIVFMVTGSGKSEIIREIILREEHSSKYPASYIRGNQTLVHFFMDSSASQLIK